MRLRITTSPDRSPYDAPATEREALRRLTRMGASTSEIATWRLLGPIEHAVSVRQQGWTPVTVMQVPDASLEEIAALTRTARRFGISREDVPLWVTAGVLSVSRPQVNVDLYWSWRRLTTRLALTMSQMAVLAGAGLTPDEASNLATSGALPLSQYRVLAALRQ